MQQLSLKEMYNLMLEFFGKKASEYSIAPQKNEITTVLYDCFIFKFGIDDMHNMFKGAIYLDDFHIVSNYLGHTISLNNDRESILNNFKIVDNYCRMRLPDKYLDVYDKMAEG